MCVSTLIAGNPLETCKLQRSDEIYASVNVLKLYVLGNQQGSPEQGNLHRLSVEILLEDSSSKWVAPKPKGMVKIWSGPYESMELLI